MIKMLCVFSLALVLFFSGCARKESAVNIPVDMEVTKLSEILENPAEYDGKRVLLEGIVGPGCLRCPSDFPYQEGIHSAKILVKGFTPARVRQGQPIRVYAEVKAVEKEVVISALAMENR